MIKRTLFSVAILLFTVTISANTALNDTTKTEDLIPYSWEPISDVDKALQYENTKDISKRSIDQSKKAAVHYTAAVELMKNKEYTAAINEFKNAMKRYKRAKLSDDALNYLRANMALSYASTGNKEDLAVSKRFLSLITSKAYSDNKWTYNIAIAHHKTGNVNEAASLLSSAIRKDEFYFQAYITLEDIYRSSGNHPDADKVIQRMQTAQEKLIKRNQKKSSVAKGGEKNKNNKKDVFIPAGKKPDVTNLKIVKRDDHLQFNKRDKIDERSMIQIQEGIGEYNLGTKALSNKEYKTAQTHLKNTEKRLKRGKVAEDGLNFSRGNLVISYLASGEKRGVGQAKRYLRSLTPKLYKSREWTYNMAVAYYQYAFMLARENRKDKTKRDWGTTGSVKNIKESITLFQKSIKKDKLFLPAYENLIYIYKEQGEDKKAIKTSNSLKKARFKLMQSFSRKEQLALGGDTYIFRLNIGTFGEFDTPVDLFEEEYLITVPITEQKTAYLAGMFYTLDEAIAYQEKMKKEGYVTSFIVAFKDGEKLEF
jgi:tetratricopeptide (TPR) repeat protein